MLLAKDKGFDPVRQPAQWNSVKTTDVKSRPVICRYFLSSRALISLCLYMMLKGGQAILSRVKGNLNRALSFAFSKEPELLQGEGLSLARY